MKTVTVYRGKNKTYTLKFVDTERRVYNISSNTELKLTVKKSPLFDTDENILISKTIQGNGGGIYTVTFTADDTKNLKPGVYKFDVQDKTRNKVLVPVSDFIIEDVVLRG